MDEVKVGDEVIIVGNSWSANVKCNKKEKGIIKRIRPAIDQKENTAYDIILIDDHNKINWGFARKDFVLALTPYKKLEKALQNL